MKLLRLMKKIYTPVLLIGIAIAPLLVCGQPDSTPGVSIHMAALQGDIEVVREHIKAGTDLDEKDAYGSTPLILSTLFGRTEVAVALIHAGADLTITDNYGATPLHMGALFCREEIVKTLLKKGVNRHIRNQDGALAFDMVAVPFEDHKPVYDQLGAALGPLGLNLDYDRIQKTRPLIAEMLRPGKKDLMEINYKPEQDGDWEVSTPKAQGLDPILVAELFYDAGEMEMPNGLLVIKNGYLIAEGYFNGWTGEQKAKLQSVTKSYTSALVGIALDQGCLSSVDQKMMHFFPEFDDQLMDSRKERITLRQLLQMRTGYPWEENSQELFEIMYRGFRPSLLAEFPLNADPGMQFEYSNLTSHLIGIITARACKSDLKSFAEEYLFGPMNVEAGDWTKDWEGYRCGHAELHLRTRDVAKFGLMYLNEGNYEEKQIVPASWVKESLENYSSDAWVVDSDQHHVGSYFKDLGYGYQWWSARLGDKRYNFAWGHGGQIVMLLDDLDMVIVVISNPQVGQHDEEGWLHEQANFNLVGKFITLLQNGRR